MSLFVIGDTHLSFGTDKPMDIFRGWENFEKRLEENWRKIIKDDDTVVVAGDISWANGIEDAKADFAFLDALPGTKLIMKGNHDFWWSTKKKSEDFFKANNFNTLKILNNNAYKVGNIAVCGSRGWFDDCGDDKKILNREANRLRMSIGEAEKLGGEPVVFLHYPPVNNTFRCDEILEVLKEKNIKRCYYGHLHGYSCNSAVNGDFEGIKMTLISADYLTFCPKLVPFVEE